MENINLNNTRYVRERFVSTEGVLPFLLDWGGVRLFSKPNIQDNQSCNKNKGT